MQDPPEVDTAGQPPVPSVENGYAAPSTGTEAILVDVLADVLGIEHVPMDGHFFEDLGADAMTIARFCARVRKRDDLPPVSMKDVYQHPTIRTLATALADAVSAPVGNTATPVESPAPAPNDVTVPGSTSQ